MLSLSPLRWLGGVCWVLPGSGAVESSNGDSSHLSVNFCEKSSGTATLTSPSTAWNVAQGPWNSIPESFPVFAAMCKWGQKHGNRVVTFGKLLLLYPSCFWGAERRLSGWDDAVDWAGFAAFGMLWHSTGTSIFTVTSQSNVVASLVLPPLRWYGPVTIKA